MSSTYKFKAETHKVLNILTHSLYTNREIFLRELLSNASDALDKLRFKQNKGESILAPELPLEIKISTDKESNILTVQDTGIGMTKQEMQDNLGIIAKSGSEKFLKDIGDTSCDSGKQKNRSLCRRRNCGKTRRGERRRFTNNRAFRHRFLFRVHGCG